MIGRRLWSVRAATLGIADVPRVPMLVIALPVPAALANLVAAVPAHLAARTQPASILRTE